MRCLSRVSQACLRGRSRWPWASTTASAASGRSSTTKSSLQRSQLADDPEAEAEILRTIYVTRGLSRGEASLIVDRVMADQDLAVDTFVRDEIGLSAETMGSPIAAAFASFAAFSLGALFGVGAA